MVHFPAVGLRPTLPAMRFVALSVLVLSGCAVGNDCAMNSFELGQRDGFSRRPPPQGD
jgi:hypothetical protein